MNTTPARVLINGFGRIGRLALRAGWNRPDLHFVGINEIKGGAKTAAHLLEFDSVQGRWAGHEISADKQSLTIDGKRLAFSEAAKPADLDLSAVDVVLESTGKFRTLETLDRLFHGGGEEGDRRSPRQRPECAQRGHGGQRCICTIRRSIAS